MNYIKNYFNGMKILLLGEGNFSFTLALGSILQ
jgi:hypothetical protein